MKIKYKINKYYRQLGATLIELLIYMSIFSMLLVVFLQIFSMTLDSQKDTKSTSAIAQDGKFIIARLTYDISSAQVIITPDLGNTGSTLELTINNNTYAYNLTNNNLTLTSGNNSDRLNSIYTIVSSFNVKRLGNSGGKNNIQVHFTLTSTVAGNKNSDTKSFQTTIGQR